MIAVAHLLIKDIPEANYFAYRIFDFLMFNQYLLHDNEILLYIEYTLYKLKKIKIIFENYYLINSKKWLIIQNFILKHILSIKFRTIKLQ